LHYAKGGKNVSNFEMAIAKRKASMKYKQEMNNDESTGKVVSNL
jgi:hypothetical protein